MPDVIAFASLVTAAVAMALGIVVWRRRRDSPMAPSLALMMVGGSAWALASVLSALATDPVAKLAWNYAVYPSVGLTVAAELWYFATLAGFGRLLNRRAALLLAVQPVVLLLVIATDPWHHLFYARAGYLTPGVFGIVTGPLYWVHVAYSYPLLVLGLGLVMRAMRRSVAGHRRLYRAVLIGATFPIVGNIATLAINPGAPTLDFTPVLFLMTTAFWLWIERRESHFEQMPISGKQVLAALDDAILVLDLKGRFMDVNPAGLALLRELASTGTSDVIGRYWRDVVSLELCAALLIEPLQTVHAGGRALDVRAAPIVGDAGGDLGVVVLIRDVTEIERLRAELVEQAAHDELTGLLNRRSLDQTLAEAVRFASSRHHELSVVMVDIDHFKAVNDQYGHAVGDQVLVGVSRVLADGVRADDVVVRLGGDEFLLLLPGDAAAAAERAELVRERCGAMQFPLAGRSFRITISVGVAALPPGGTPQDVVRLADEALYAAKAAGRDAVRVV